MKTEVLILGAGGAGLMAAITAGSRGRKVILLDHAQKAGAKLLISGGGRCNFTHLKATADNYVGENPHFCKSALARYTPQDFLKKVEAAGIAWEEKAEGQLFCKGPARDLLEHLLKEAAEAGVDLQLGKDVISAEKKGKGFEVKTNYGNIECESLVIATGGLSFPKLGASDLGYSLARKFGHNLIPQAAALDAFVFKGPEQKLFDGLSGLSAPVVMTTGKKSFEEPVLITHTGLSGPAALQCSLYWKKGAVVHVDWLPKKYSLLDQKKRAAKAKLFEILPQTLPARLAARLASLMLPENRMLGETSNEALEKVEASLRDWRFTPASTAGYDRAEVTRGGVDTKEISSKTMESRKVKGLYFVGEVMDVTGQLGGYNFQWAWSSGHAAGSVA